MKKVFLLSLVVSLALLAISFLFPVWKNHSDCPAEFCSDMMFITAYGYPFHFIEILNGGLAGFNNEVVWHNINIVLNFIIYLAVTYFVVYLATKKKF